MVPIQPKRWLFACGLLVPVAAPVGGHVQPPGDRHVATRPAGQPDAVPALTVAAAWELRLLGCDTSAKLEQLRRFPKRRHVRLALVGQGGVSRQQLGSLLGEANTLTYHECGDPGSNTHDTQMARVIIELTQPLGVQIDLHIWQAGPSFRDYAKKFRQAAVTNDVVALFQSFWGPDAKLITQAIRESPGALFISPYVEHGGHPTAQTPQGSACRPWAPETIGHFVTVAPLPERGPPGTIVTPSDRRPDDSEAVNFIAPSYHANGPGGTCPSAAVATACACYLSAILPTEPLPSEIIDRLRRGSGLDRRLLTSVKEFDAQTIDRLATQIASLRSPPPDRQRKLDADGILNLYIAYRHVADCPPCSGRALHRP